MNAETTSPTAPSPELSEVPVTRGRTACVIGSGFGGLQYRCILPGGLPAGISSSGRRCICAR